MPAKYQQLLKLLNSFDYKISELSAFRLFNNDISNSKIIESSQLCIVEKYLEKELMELSKMFDVSTKSAIILCSMFFNSFTELFVSRAVSEEDLASAICLDSYVISDLSESISELESKKIIKVKLLNASTEKSYWLTEDFINTITKF